LLQRYKAAPVTTIHNAIPIKIKPARTAPAQEQQSNKILAAAPILKNSHLGPNTTHKKGKASLLI
jgi:hypothetical protein